MFTGKINKKKKNNNDQNYPIYIIFFSPKNLKEKYFLKKKVF